MSADNQSVIHIGDCLESLRGMPDCSVQCCVTSPPYFGLRDYGVDGQIGLETTPDEYVAKLVAVFREVRRVLADDGVCFVNLGDSYAANRTYQVTPTKWKSLEQGQPSRVPDGLKPKDLIGIPWRVAFALQADGWWLRQDIIWSKPNPMPESVRDRCTSAHEYLFLLTKKARYFWDAKAMQEPSTGRERWFGDCGYSAKSGRNDGSSVDAKPGTGTRNRRSVWAIAPSPYPGAHFAVMPPKLVEPCILAGSRPGDVVLDPFAGSGTVGAVALAHGRRFVGCELNPEYLPLIQERLKVQQCLVEAA